MNTERQFTEVGNSASNNVRWEPHKTQLMPGAPFPFLEGYFKDLRELQGQQGPFSVGVITTLNPDGSLGHDVDISGGKALEDKLSETPLGSYIRIQYEGKLKSKSTGNNYNSFKVFVDSNAIPFSQIGGAVAMKKAPQQQVAAQQQAPQPFNPSAGFQQQAANPFQQHQQQAPATNPFQQQQGPFGQAVNPQQPVYQQPAVQQPFQQQGFQQSQVTQQQAPNPFQQQPVNPVPQQTWTPPVQQSAQPQQPVYQQPAVQPNTLQSPQSGQVFGGNQMMPGNDDLPF